MRRFAGLALAALAAALFVSPALAGEERGGIRYFGEFMAPSSDYKVGDTQTKLTSTLGVGLGAYVKANDWITIDFDVKFLKPEVRVAANGEVGKKRVRVLPITVGPMFHFGDANWRFYAGPELAYMNYGKISEPENVKFKSQLTWGVKAGLDVPLSQRWSGSVAVEYIDAKMTVDMDGGPDLKPKPVIVSFGATYRF